MYHSVTRRTLIMKSVAASTALPLVVSELAACRAAPETRTPTAASPTAGIGQPVSPTPQVTQPQPTQTPVGRRKLVISIGAEPRSLDPLLVEDGQRDSFNYSVYEGLTGRNSADMTIIPKLAERWEVDRTTWTFYLRDGVTFHDGRPVTAEDVVASYRRMLNPDLKGERAGSVLGGVTSVEVVDDKTVKITTEEPDPTVPARATLVMVAPKDWADPSSRRMDTEMMGTGPYRFVSWERGQRIRLASYDRHWSGQQPVIDEVEITFAPEDAVRLASLLAGEIQIARNMPPDLVDKAPKVVSGPISEVSMLRLNAAQGRAFADVRVRKAANMAVNRQLIIDQLYRGFASPAKGQITGQFVFGANPDLNDYPYDPDQAKRLLEEAGATGAEITMSVTTGRWLKDREIGEAIAEMLNEVGFKVQLEFPEFSQWLQQLFVAGEDDTKAPDVMFIGHGNEMFDPEFSLGLYVTCEGEASAICFPDVDKLVVEARHELNEKRRQELYRQIWKMLYEEAAYVAIANVNQLHFTAENVIWTPRPDGFIMFNEIRFSD